MGTSTVITANPGLYARITVPDGQILICLIVAWFDHDHSGALSPVFVGPDGTVATKNLQPKMEQATLEIVEGPSL